jgi:hypothetical protein
MDPGSTIDLKLFREDGFYLVFKDGGSVRLTPQSILAYVREFFADPKKVPPSVRNAVDIEPCSICTKIDSGEFCHALCPVLPLLDLADRYASYEEVTAVHRDAAKDLTAVRHTTMQGALQHVSVLSLIYYCDVGQQYRDYLMGVEPLMDFVEVLDRIFLNIFWLNGGDMKKVAGSVQKFSSDLDETIQCQIKRLKLLCKKDSFTNSFANFHLITYFLSTNMNVHLERSLAAFRQKCLDEAAKYGNFPKIR